MTVYWCRECCKPILKGQSSVSTAVSVEDNYAGYGLFSYHETCLDAMPEKKRKQAGKIKSTYFKESDRKLRLCPVMVVDLENLIDEISSNGEGSSLSLIRDWVNDMKSRMR